jgi:hypothetical protein
VSPFPNQVNSNGVPNATPVQMISSSGANEYMLFTFGSPSARATRRVRIETNAYFCGLNVDSSGSLTAPANVTPTRLFMLGDSFGEGQGITGSSVFYLSYAAILARMNGWELWDLGQGGTGVIGNSSGTKLTYAQRALPPVNAWVINTEPLTVAGTFTLSQGGVTSGSVATNASASTIQTALNSAFGSNTFYIVSQGYYGTF